MYIYYITQNGRQTRRNSPDHDKNGQNPRIEEGKKTENRKDSKLWGEVKMKGNLEKRQTRDKGQD